MKLSFLNPGNTVRKQTLILGQNGTGKSNILKAIALITSGSSSIFDLLKAPDDWIKQGKKELSICADLINEKEEVRSLKFSYKKGQTKSDILLNNREAFTIFDRALDYTSRNYFVVG